MNVVAGLAREYWIRTWKMRQKYHRFEVKGAEVLQRPGPAIIAGYHGRPFASDLLMLQVHMLDRSVACRPLVHDSFAKSPFFRPIVEGMGFLTGEGPELDRAVAEGAKIIITPGGGKESMRASTVRYRSNWENRLGFARLALQKRLPIIPAAGAGVDDQYLSLIDGYRTARRLGLPKKMMLFFGVGPLGLFPFSPPFPVKITLHLGRPIPPEGDAKSEKDVQALHARVVGAVEVLLDKVREENCAGALYQPEDATWA